MEDHCTLFPDQNYGSTCCAQHDSRYKYKRIPRDLADIELGRCVYGMTKDPYLSSFMYLGVVALGWIWWERYPQRIKKLFK